MPVTGQSITFSHALAKRPSPKVADGIRAEDTGTPDFERFTAHHGAYLDALADAGVVVDVLEGDDAFPDSVFIEDTALCLPEGVVIMRPGAPSRLGETETIRHALGKYYSQVAEIAAPAFIEGGDILVTDSEVLVGLSDRTTAEGYDQLASILNGWDYETRMLQTPEGVLHFKTDCGLVDEETILATGRLAASGCFDGYRVIEVPGGEEPAANAICVNGTVLLADGFPRTADLLASFGYRVKTLANSEAAKLDGGLSCMSLRFSAP